MKKINVFIIITIFSILHVNAQKFLNHEWTKSLKGSKNSAQFISSITSDLQDNNYTIGTFSQTTDFDFSVDTFNITESYGFRDLFIQKTDVNGNLTWVKTLKSKNGFSFSDFYPSKIITDNNDNIYIMGLYSGKVDFNPGIDTFNLIGYSGGSGGDVFILKLNSNGDFLWVKSYGRSVLINCFDIEIDIDNNVYIVGDFKGEIDFDPGIDSFNITSWNGGAYILKLDEDGNFLRVNTLEGNISYRSISLDNNNLYLTGSYSSTVDFDPGIGIHNLTSNSFSLDIFIQKLDALGNFIWTKSIGGSLNDAGTTIYIDNSNLYISGVFRDSVNFNLGLNNHNLTSSGSNDIFLLKLNNIDGSLYWVKSYGGDDSEYPTSTIISNDNIYIVGELYSTSNFNSELSNYYFSSIGENDAFILNINSTGELIDVITYGSKSDDVCEDITSNNNGEIFIVGYYGGDTLNASFFNGNNILISDGGYDGFISKFKTSSVGIEKGMIIENFKIYPNPAKEMLTLKLPDNVDDANISILDITGKQYHSELIIGNQSSFNIDIPKGIYFVKIETEAESVVKKLIVE